MGDEPLPELMMALLIGFARARIFSSEFMQTSIIIRAREIIDIPDKQEDFFHTLALNSKGSSLGRLWS